MDAKQGLLSGNILALLNSRARTFGGLSGVLCRRQKPGVLCTVSSGGSLALTPAHTGLPSRDQTKFNGDRTGPQGYLTLCASLRALSKFFGPCRECCLAYGLFKRLEFMLGERG